MLVLLETANIIGSGNVFGPLAVTLWCEVTSWGSCRTSSEMDSFQPVLFIAHIVIHKNISAFLYTFFFFK